MSPCSLRALCTAACLVHWLWCGGRCSAEFYVRKPRFFQGLNLLADDTRAAFPDFEALGFHCPRHHRATRKRRDRRRKEQKDAAAALLYASFALVAGQHAIEVKQTELTSRLAIQWR